MKPFFAGKFKSNVAQFISACTLKEDPVYERCVCRPSETRTTVAFQISSILGPANLNYGHGPGPAGKWVASSLISAVEHGRAGHISIQLWY